MLKVSICILFFLGAMASHYSPPGLSLGHSEKKNCTLSFLSDFGLKCKCLDSCLPKATIFEESYSCIFAIGGCSMDISLDGATQAWVPLSTMATDSHNKQTNKQTNNQTNIMHCYSMQA